jgi:regulator of ribonuclease activity A
MVKWSCADICDELGDSVSYCSAFPFKHFSQLSKFHGRIRTVSCFEDNSRVKEILSSPGNSDVLVVDGKGSQRRALLGDQIASAALKNGWAGVLVHGAIRDSEIIGEFTDIGVCALGTNPRKSERRGEGTVGDIVTFAGLTFVSGEYVYVDSDGIIISTGPISIN